MHVRGGSGVLLSRAAVPFPWGNARSRRGRGPNGTTNRRGHIVIPIGIGPSGSRRERREFAAGSRRGPIGMRNRYGGMVPGSRMIDTTHAPEWFTRATPPTLPNDRSVARSASLTDPVFALGPLLLLRVLLQVAWYGPM